MKKYLLAICLTCFGVAIIFSNMQTKMSDKKKEVKILQSFWPTFHSPPFRLKTAGDWVTLQNIYSNLVEIEGTNDVRPDLARKWERSPDGLTWVFYLRDNLRWSDGTKMTAGQIVTSLKNAGKGTTHSKLSTYVANIHSVGETQIVFSLIKQPKNFLLTLSYVDLAIVHPDALQDNFSWENPTSGPYRVDILDKQSIRYIANQHHWTFSARTISEIHSFKASATPNDVQTLLELDWDACHLAPGIADETDIHQLKTKYNVFTGDSDFLVSLFFKPSRAKSGHLKASLRKFLLKKIYLEFWKNEMANPFRATGLRPLGTLGALSYKEFDQAFSQLDDIAYQEFPRPLNILVSEKHSSRKSVKKVTQILDDAEIPFRLTIRDNSDFDISYQNLDFDLVFRFLGASEGDPDSAWRIYNETFATPVATADELDYAQIVVDSKRRDHLYKMFERKAIKEALFIPLKNETTYILTSDRIELDTSLATDWGLKLSKLYLRQ